MATLMRIERDIERTRSKIVELQTKLKDLETERTAAENLEIIGVIRSLKMTKAELSAFIESGTLPGSVEQPQALASRPAIKRQAKRAENAGANPTTSAPTETITKTSTESEDESHED